MVYRPDLYCSLKNEHTCNNKTNRTEEKLMEKEQNNDQLRLFQILCDSKNCEMKLFSSSAQLSMKFQLLINAEIVKISDKIQVQTSKTGNLSCR